VSNAELAVTAALGASFLTGLASLGVVAFQNWLSGRSADSDALIGAVTEMLSRSMAVSMRAQAMGETMRIRSGISEAVDVSTPGMRSAQAGRDRDTGRDGKFRRGLSPP
jgi:hypothetical protein